MQLSDAALVADVETRAKELSWEDALDALGSIQRDSGVGRGLAIFRWIQTVPHHCLAWRSRCINKTSRS